MKPSLRCAIYTRKSTDEGLEQEFNSLDAQREACEAYITSQKHEGWKALPAMYNDGGFSGGNIERPALRRLLADIEAKEVNVVVVYKVDRLTRSLADFAKIIEVFDRQGVSFVSITQQFNTTSSMGRLTLNVLLSFAQFEREVTGERIRDKVAASKAKGMWMGGTVALGYDAKDKKLVPSPEEAKLVRHIFERYLALQNILDVRDELNAQGYRTKYKPHLNGKSKGGYSFCHGQIRNILRNKLYLGFVRHKGREYKGEHQAIISQELWDAVQKQMEENTSAHRTRQNVTNPSMLIGKIFDASGKRLTGTGSNKGAKRYRYYETPPEFRKGPNKPTASMRLPAAELDRAVCKQIAKFLANDSELITALGLKGIGFVKKQKIAAIKDEAIKNLTVKTPQENMEFVRSLLKNIYVGNDFLSICLSKISLCAHFGVEISALKETDANDGELKLEVPCKIRRFGIEKRIILSGEDTTTSPATLQTLKKALVRAQIWREELFSEPATNIEKIAKANGVTDRYVAFIIELSFISPKIMGSILNGGAPPNMSLQNLIRKMPIAWSEQVAKFKAAQETSSL